MIFDVIEYIKSSDKKKYIWKFQFLFDCQLKSNMKNLIYQYSRLWSFFQPWTSALTIKKIAFLKMLQLHLKMKSPSINYA